MAYISAATQGSAEYISSCRLDDGRIMLSFGAYAYAILTKTEAQDVCAALAAALHTLAADSVEAGS